MSTQTGFVYVLSNPAHPGLMKIGYSTKVPEERAAELWSTGVTEPFSLEYYCLVEHARALESKVHERLSFYRYRANREFFAVSVFDAIQAIRICGTDIKHEWESPNHSFLPKQPPKGSLISTFVPQRRADKPVEAIALPQVKATPVACPKCHAHYSYALRCPRCGVALQRNVAT
jgi:T5orf172 domain